MKYTSDIFDALMQGKAVQHQTQAPGEFIVLRGGLFDQNEKPVARIDYLDYPEGWHEVDMTKYDWSDVCFSQPSSTFISCTDSIRVTKCVDRGIVVDPPNSDLPISTLSKYEYYKIVV